MKWIGKYLSYTLIFFSIGIYIFPGRYIFELAASFLPYIVATHIFLAGYWLSKIFFVRHNRWKYLVLIGLHVLGFVYFLLPLLSFYEQGTSVGSQTGDISVLYANISKVNHNYTGLMDMIDIYDPDVLMFVEFADHHDEHLKPFLAQRYPYINRTSWAKKFVGSMVFSKYLVDDLADDFVQGAWRYGYFSIQTAKQLYYVYLVHTSSPISPLNYHMRNEQLDTVDSDILTHASSRKLAPILVLGDLNLSPWSVMYQRFVSQIGDFVNVTRRFPLIFSRHLRFLPFVASHIDHIFSTNPDTITDIQQVDVPGSDHEGYLFHLKSN